MLACFAASFFQNSGYYDTTGYSQFNYWYVWSRLVSIFKKLCVWMVWFRDQGSVIKKKTFDSSHPKRWHVVTAERLNARRPSRTSTKNPSRLTQAVSPRKSWQTSLARTIYIAIVNQDEPSLPVYVAQCSTSACQALHWSGMQNFSGLYKVERSENMETRSATFHKCTSTPTSNNLGFCFWTPWKVHNVADLQQSKRSVASEEALRFPSMAICVSTWSTPNSQVPTTACTGKHADETASAKSGIVCACRCVATVAWNTCHNN